MMGLVTLWFDDVPAPQRSLLSMKVLVAIVLALQTLLWIGMVALYINPYAEISHAFTFAVGWYAWYGEMSVYTLYLWGVLSAGNFVASVVILVNYLLVNGDYLFSASEGTVYNMTNAIWLVSIAVMLSAASIAIHLFFISRCHTPPHDNSEMAKETSPSTKRAFGTFANERLV